jgi:hypothetical protein
MATKSVLYINSKITGLRFQVEIVSFLAEFQTVSVILLRHTFEEFLLDQNSFVSQRLVWFPVVAKIAVLVRPTIHSDYPLYHTNRPQNTESSPHRKISLDCLVKTLDRRIRGCKTRRLVKDSSAPKSRVAVEIISVSFHPLRSEVLIKSLCSLLVPLLRELME